MDCYQLIAKVTSTIFTEDNSQVCPHYSSESGASSSSYPVTCNPSRCHDVHTCIRFQLSYHYPQSRQFFIQTVIVVTVAFGCIFYDFLVHAHVVYLIFRQRHRVLVERNISILFRALLRKSETEYIPLPWNNRFG